MSKYLLVSAFQSLNDGVKFMKENKNLYDTELYNRIMLEYNMNFSSNEFISVTVNSTRSVVLANSQYKAYERIMNTIKNAKLVSNTNNLNRDEQKDNVDVEGYNGTNKPSAPDSTDN